MSPVMEVLTGIMIAILIFYSGKLIINEELGINNFFSFLAAMMLAYQPVKTLSKVKCCNWSRFISSKKNFTNYRSIKIKLKINSNEKVKA